MNHERCSSIKEEGAVREGETDLAIHAGHEHFFLAVAIEIGDFKGWFQQEHQHLQRRDRHRHADTHTHTQQEKKYND